MLSSTISLPLVLLTVLFIIPESTSQSATCTAPADEDTPPAFICQFDVTVTRLNRCAIRITERFQFPYTTGNFGFRFIPALDRVQGVGDIRITRNGEVLKVGSVESNDPNTLRIPLETEFSEQPVVFELRYDLSNGAMRYTKTCRGLDDEPDPTKNVMRWRSGAEWDQTLRVLNVAFETDMQGSTLALLGGEQAQQGSSDQRIIVRKENVEGNIEIYVSESGVTECEEDLACFPDGPNLGVIIGLSLAGGLVIIVILICIVAKCRTRHLVQKQRQESQTQSV